ncbi:MAG TPA: hypothetical protein VG650_16790 [Mycobacteriales bacterium]|nr:hypothetical protein [Mycobacteriales bacterium]
MRAVPATLPALPAVALLIFGLVALPAHAASGPATAVRTVSPLTSAGTLKPGYKVTRREGHGTCQSGSFMTGRADRCATPASGAVVLDPCWPAAEAKTFVCQAKPWLRKVVELHVPGAVSDGPGPHHQSLPWGMRVGASLRCLLDPGSVRRLSGHPLLFHCTHHRDVFGPLHRNGSRWTAHVYRTGARTRSGYRSLGWLAVHVAWYGAAPAPEPAATPTPSLLPSLSPTASDSTAPSTTAPTATASPTS